MNIENVVISESVDGPFRSYELHSYGDTLEELLANAAISEIDQDGGEWSCVDLADTLDHVYELAHKYILKQLNQN